MRKKVIRTRVYTNPFYEYERTKEVEVKIQTLLRLGFVSASLVAGFMFVLFASMF